MYETGRDDTVVDETTRRVAWAIAETWWRKNHRRAAGSVPEASSSQEYADTFWQGFLEEARAAIAAMSPVRADLSPTSVRRPVR